MHIPRDTFDGRHSANHLRCRKELVINGINYQTQLVSLPSIVSFYHNDGQNQNPANHPNMMHHDYPNIYKGLTTIPGGCWTGDFWTIRLERYVGALRTLVLSIASSMASLLWQLRLHLGRPRFKMEGGLLQDGPPYDWMSRGLLGSMVIGSMVYNLLINGVYWGYNPYTPEKRTAGYPKWRHTWSRRYFF